jgi:hypothetical protein
MMFTLSAGINCILTSSLYNEVPVHSQEVSGHVVYQGYRFFLFLHFCRLDYEVVL